VDVREEDGGGLRRLRDKGTTEVGLWQSSASGYQQDGWSGGWFELRGVVVKETRTKEQSSLVANRSKDVDQCDKEEWRWSK
jgi:hypothetical protein